MMLMSGLLDTENLRELLELSNAQAKGIWENYAKRRGITLLKGRSERRGERSQR